MTRRVTLIQQKRAGHRTAIWSALPASVSRLPTRSGQRRGPLTSARSPAQKNVDAVFMKTFTVSESKTAQAA
jgi:hypothetical protein